MLYLCSLQDSNPTFCQSNAFQAACKIAVEMLTTVKLSQPTEREVFLSQTVLLELNLVRGTPVIRNQRSNCAALYDVTGTC